MDVVAELDTCTARAPGRVRRHLAGIGDEAVELAELFRLLGDQTRAQLLYALLEAGELCVCDLTATVEVSDTAVSHALRLLRTAGIVASRRAGRMVFYRLADQHVRMLLDLSREHLRHAVTDQTEARHAHWA